MFKGLVQVIFIAAHVVAFNNCDAQQTPRVPLPINREKADSLIQSIERFPDSLAYHVAYLKAIGWTGELYWNAEKYPSRFDSAETELQSQYAKWIKKFPNTATVYEAIGTAYYESESPKAASYLKKTIELNPQNAAAYLKLAIDAERWGNKEAAQEYMRLAAVADPSNPAYSFYYAMYFDETDMNHFRKLIYELTKKFPEHERGAQGLYWLAYNEKGIENKIRVYEELKKLYPPLKFSWSSSGMYSLYDQYLFAKNFDAAISLSESLLSKDGWKDQLTFAKNISFIHGLIQKKDYKQAYDSIIKLKKSRFSRYESNVTLMEAELADNTGNTLEAYNKILVLHAKSPTDELQQVAAEYAVKLGKDAASINSDLWSIRNKTVKPATPFELGLYTANAKAKLSDYKGKVVLLTFWFPGCGPCRAEFPHFENVVKKYAGKDLVYLGINVFPKQDEYVIPFMKGTKYSFTPLKGTSEWALDAYGVRGEPTNFLIDKEGNIVFANFRTDQDNERTLELMINALLRK